MPLDHFTLVVPFSKIDDIVAFLTTSLHHLSFKEHIRPVPSVVGLGESEPYFWIEGIDADVKTFDLILKHQHFAFVAENREQVREFYDRGLKMGGTCNGEPGLREHYDPGYYGAFVRDPACGVNFEVVCRKEQ